MRAPADAGVLALGVLAHEEHVDVRRPAAGERARDPLEQPRRPEVRPEVEPLPDLEDQPPERDVVGHGRDRRPRPSARRRARGELLERVRRHHPAVLVPVGGAPRQLRPLDRKPEGVDRLPGLRDHLGADAVAGEDARPGASSRRADPSAGTLSRYASASSTGTTSAYFAWMSNRFASCGACARSADALARDDRRPAVLEQVDRGRADAAARRRPAEDHRVDALRDQDRGEVRPEERRTRPSSARSSRRRAARAAGRSRPSWPPIWRSPSAGTFWSQRPPSFRLGSKPIVVKITGRPFARAASSSRFVASTAAVSRSRARTPGR